MLNRIALLSIFFVCGTCLYNAESVKWHRYPYIVKVLARELKSKNGTTCTGSLISESAVLTSAKCFPNPEMEYEAMAIIAVPGSRKVMRKAMLEFRIDEDIAVMRIDTIVSRRFCDKPPHPSRISRLNFKPSLTEGSFHLVDPKELAKLRCRIVGFETVDKVDDFHKSNKAQVLELELQYEGKSVMFSEIYSNTTGTACWDDIGAPLECALNEEDVWIQVGIVNSLYGRIEETKTQADATCSNVEAMEFIVFNNDALIRSIDIVDKIGVFSAAHKCF
ncbi:unnamed protein product [Caenorhabditis bovis]|uniref:Peptidase S1 domain-containing protein n=1 Tax=Caenorhabditis bovis TaxID=2654633 RepID=A0A8S1EK50_9PELO|nr:unnamed protein product [Caenorhabditis bovis]